MTALAAMAVVLAALCPTFRRALAVLGWAALLGLLAIVHH
jgi:hypothetical protein